MPFAIVVELFCAALDAGLSLSAAWQATFTACGPSIAPQWRSLVAEPGVVTRPAPSASRRHSHGRADDGLDAFVRTLSLAHRSGASAAVLLRRLASDERAASRQRVATATGRLGVRLVLPLGLTTLPAFVLLGVAPVVLGLATELLHPS